MVLDPRLPVHLGGGENRCHTDPGTLRYLKEQFGIKTMIDVGCGLGLQTETANELNIDSIGLDGDFTLDRTIPFILHDFEDGPYNSTEKYDLAWCVEFLEHVEEQYIDNFFAVFNMCKYVVCTAAPPGKGGHHHVNCQTEEYWHEKFAERGFEYDPVISAEIRSRTTMLKKFMKRTGMFYVNTEYK